MTWAEFVEARLVRQYRQEPHVKLQEVRAFIAKLRDEEGVPYPLAHFKRWVGEGRHLLLELQQESALPGELWLVAPANNQIVLTEPAAAFLRRVEWDGDLPVAWRPHDDEHSPVRCRPTQRFGKPSIGGANTEVIVEHLDGGECENEVAEQFGLNIDDVRWGSCLRTVPPVGRVKQAMVRFYFDADILGLDKLIPGLMARHSR